jgi:hypothetical protein
MKTLRRLVLAALFLCAASAAHAQALQPPIGPPVLVQRSPTDLQACSVSHGDAAINTLVTLTVTPPAGQYVYLCGWDYQVATNGTATAQSNVKWTSTNLGGLAVEYSTPATANTTIVGTYYFNVPIRSATPGTAITIVSPAIAAQNAYSANAYYYFAP